jgi:predicted transposase YbfD/YdcC
MAPALDAAIKAQIAYQDSGGAGWGLTTVLSGRALITHDHRAPLLDAATFCLLFRRLDRQALEACLGRWVAQVLAAVPAPRRPGLAIDGKTLRGSRQQGAPLAHLLSAVSHGLGLTLGQVAVDDKTNEITAIHILLQQLLLQGQVVTVDALLTQHKIAQAIVDAGADYIMLVKENQPGLHAAIATAFADPALLAEHPHSRARSMDRGHGRLERRVITLSSALADYLDWPGQQQVFELVRTRTNLRTGAVQAETVYGITSLAIATAAFVLQRVR